MKSRPRGTGTIEQRGDVFLPRLPNKGAWLRPCASWDDASALLDAVLYKQIDAGTLGVTLRSFGPGFLAERKDKGGRTDETDRSRWRRHVASDPIAALPLRALTRADVREWLERLERKRVAPGKGHKSAPDRRLSRSMVQGTLNLLRSALARAVDRQLVGENPARDVRLERSRGATHEPWTYLLPDEQAALLGCEGIPRADRLLLAFAIGTGLRQGEQWNLEFRDVHADHVVVRYGGKGAQTKSGRIRRVPLFGLAADALAAWLPLLAAQPNPHGLVWPLPSGARRQKGKPIKGWRAHLAAAGLVPERRHDGQPVRHHDLRHTCGSSLVAGWWGRRWTLEEVRALLGHSTIAMTERYAHLGETALRAAARGTPGVQADGAQRSSSASAVDLGRGREGRDGAVVVADAPRMPHKINPAELQNPLVYSERDTGFEPATLSLGRRRFALRCSDKVPDRGASVGRELRRLAAEGLRALAENRPTVWAEVARALVQVDRLGAELEVDFAVDEGVG